MNHFGRRLWNSLARPLVWGRFEYSSFAQALAPMATPADTLRVILQITYPLVFLIFLFALAARAFGISIPYWLIGLLTALEVGLTAVETRALRKPEHRRQELARRLGVVHLGMSLLLLTIAVAASGGVQSAFVWAYGLVVAIEAILRGRRWALASAAASAVLLLTATGLVRAGLAPNQPTLWTASTTTAFLISYNGMFLAVALALSGLGEYLRGQNRGIGQLAAQLRESYLSTIRALVEAVEAKDPYTAGHSSRVERRVTQAARRMNLTDPNLDQLTFAAILHDVGKIGVPDAILRKPGSLTAEEWVRLKDHTRIGALIVERVPFLTPAARIVRHHHERFDGSGYPDRLRGDAIPLGSRIIHVVDAYEAMTSTRPYRQALARSAAIAELQAGAGTQFDPAVVKVFLEVLGAETPQYVTLAR